MAGKSFERFYYEKVALGEGCGCAEQIIGTRDLERHARETAAGGAAEAGRPSPWAWLGGLIRGLARDPLKSES